LILRLRLDACDQGQILVVELDANGFGLLGRFPERA
jgi:hypothetical protein